jgi:hypothetical protein
VSLFNSLLLGIESLLRGSDALESMLANNLVWDFESTLCTSEKPTSERARRTTANCYLIAIDEYCKLKVKRILLSIHFLILSAVHIPKGVLRSQQMISSQIQELKLRKARIDNYIGYLDNSIDFKVSEAQVYLSDSQSMTWIGCGLTPQFRPAVTNLCYHQRSGLAEKPYKNRSNC